MAQPSDIVRPRARRRLPQPTRGANRPFAAARPGADWRERGACRQADPELFFPVGTVGPAAAQILAAKQVCAACPVTAECRVWALETGQSYGVWGGLTEEERRALGRSPALG